MGAGIEFEKRDGDSKPTHLVPLPSLAFNPKQRHMYVTRANHFRGTILFGGGIITSYFPMFYVK